MTPDQVQQLRVNLTGEPPTGEEPTDWSEWEAPGAARVLADPVTGACSEPGVVVRQKAGPSYKTRASTRHRT